jgi:hypothetical protein
MSREVIVSGIIQVLLYYITKDVAKMARKIEIGTTFYGQDAIDFIHYMRNPTYTDRVKNLMKQAIREAEERSECTPRG